MIVVVVVKIEIRYPCLSVSIRG